MSLHVKTVSENSIFNINKNDDLKKIKHILKYVVQNNILIKLWECSICSREYKQFYMLQRHLTSHTDERKYSCYICFKTFRQIATLNQHYSTHSTAKPYVCQICQKSFGRSSTLISHYKIHKTEKPFKCHICTKAFHQKGNLRNHLFCHTNARPYLCRLCDKGFNQQSNLVCHIKKVFVPVTKIDFKKYGHLVKGKSTYCSTIVKHAADYNRTIDVVNLDPAAEHFDYEPLVDIRDLIQLDDAMEDEQLRYGPNGGLVFCIETLLENSEWLEDKLGNVDDDYILFDCPGQVELYTHLTVIRNLVEQLQKWNFRLAAIFLIDSQFMVDGAKFLSGTMAALSVMINLELPHVNILSKMDLLSKSALRQLDRFLEPDPHSLLADMAQVHSKWYNKYRKLSESLGKLIEDFSLVRFYPLNTQNEDSITDILLTVDNIIQYGEENDVKTRDFEQLDSED